MGKIKRRMKREQKRQQKKSTALANVKKNYPVALFEDDAGDVEPRALIPMDEAVTLADENKKQGLIARVSAAMRGWFRSKTSAADDVGTTEIGSTASAVAIGEGFFTSNLHKHSKEENTRKSKYNDYIKIDEECTELSRALSVTVSNVFTSREGDQDSYQIKSQNERVVKLIEDVDQRTDMQRELPGVCRSLLRLGDDFEEIVVDRAMSVVRIKWLNQKYMYRKEDEFGRLQAEGAYEMRAEDDHLVGSFAPWQVVHLRHDHQRGNLYGRSFFFSARKPWRLLQMMEDGLVMNRLVRAVDKLVYYIPGEPADETEAKRILGNARRDLKRKSVIDSSTGKLDTSKSVLADDEDIFVLTNKDNPAKVERLSTSGVIGQLSDVEYFQNKMFMATGVPKSYLGLERDVNAKATLSWQDIEYARLLRHIQREMAWFQRKVYDLQLQLVGVTPDKELYQVEYPPISFVDEEMKMTIENLKWTIATVAKGMNIPLEWILQHIVGLSEEDTQDLVVTIEPGTPQQSPAMPNQPSQVPSPTDARAIRNAVVKDAKLAASIQDLKNMLYVVRNEQLNLAGRF